MNIIYITINMSQNDQCLIKIVQKLMDEDDNPFMIRCNIGTI